jgi:F0F1-type ATP synthase epsilon subunit
VRAKVLEIDKKIFDGEAVKIVVPSVDGEMCLLQNHSSIVVSLKRGAIRIFEQNDAVPISIPVSSGVCSFSNNSAVFVLSN